MALKIVWTKIATEKFDSILEYLEAKWGEKSKVLFIKKTFDFLDILELFPELGKIENENLNIRGFVLIKQISIFYQIKKKKIVLLSFHDNRKMSKNI